ncbi:hypothetical protein HMPREF1403_00576 [Helicobacter pylori GAM201Ai]|nr:hypothetical protein HMPREF1403_00576 [Helicobacter pylori GAM201Ai]
MIIKKLDWGDKNIKGVRDQWGTPNHYRNGTNYSVSTLNGIRSYHKRV